MTKNITKILMEYIRIKYNISYSWGYNLTVKSVLNKHIIAAAMLGAISIGLLTV